MKRWLLALCVVLTPSREVSQVGSPASRENRTTTAGPQRAPILLHGHNLVAGRGLGVAIQLQVVGQRLVLINLPPRAPIEVRDAATGRLLKNIGVWGNGDGEFAGPWYIDPAPDGTELCWVYDLTLHRLAHLDVSDAGLKASESVRGWLTLRSDAALTNPVWADDTVFTLGFFHTGRLAAFGPDGRFARFLGAARTKPDEPVVITQQAYQSVMRPSPDRRHFAAATQFAEQLEILGRDGSVEANGQVPGTFGPRYSIVYDRGEPRLLRDRRSRYGYLDIAADSLLIYALFSGRTDAEVGGYPSGREIHVFDWKGRLVSEYTLPHYAIGFALDRRRHVLYVMHTEPRPAIAVYRLPSSQGQRSDEAR